MYLGLEALVGLDQMVEVLELKHAHSLSKPKEAMIQVDKHKTA